MSATSRTSAATKRPTSFRLPPGLLDRLDAEAAAGGLTTTALVACVLAEGLKTRRFPGVIYRDGPTGRRAALAGGPDIWEIVRAIKSAHGSSEQRIRAVARERAIAAAKVRLAVEFYASYPDEIDARLADDDRAAEQAHELIERREQLFAT